MLCILKAILAWIVMSLIGTNLIGFFVRPLADSPRFVGGAADLESSGFVREEYRRTLIGGLILTCLELLMIVAYLFALFHFWNAWLALAGLILMIQRIPDLIWEIRTGLRVSRTIFPKGPVYLIARALWWGSLLLIWYSFSESTP